MSREPIRKPFYNRDRDRDWDRDRDRDRQRNDFRSRPMPRKRSRSPIRHDRDKRRSRSPRKTDKDVIDDNILSEISKLPEPSELWDNQFQETNFSGPPPPPGFATEPVPNSSYAPSYPQQYPGYDDFPTLASMPVTLPPEMVAWNQMSLPPPPTAPTPFINSEDQIKKEAAIETEMRHQKAALSKQREDYIKKAAILKKELDTLKDQRNELRGDAKRSPSPDTKRFLKENTKLQLEIQNKLKTITNVVDMLNGIIGEEAQEIPESDDSSERTKRRSRSPTNKKFNYVYYDPEMHWCRVCNEFPPTAKDYLNHLHSAAHHKMAAAHMEAPWHSVTGVNEGFPSFVSAPTKRTPIRGLQFFVPSTAWYCKLCDQFIGDLHCASAHLKSVVHSKNYTNFVEQNPHWETDWMSDRQKAFEKARASKGKVEDKPQYAAHTITFNKDGFHTKRKDSPQRDDDKKKKKKKKSKKRSSSSSSEASSSDSEPAKKKKDKKDHHQPEDKSLTEWVSAIKVDRLNDSDRKLLDNLKSRMKLDKQHEKRRSRERSRSLQRAIADQQRKLRDLDRRSRESRESRDRRSPSRRREESRSSPSRDKKQEVKKMPFIGKMPVYKNLSKKSEEQKKEEDKKREDEEAVRRRREEMDAEIQKKVAEFKEKIAKAQVVQPEPPPSGLPLPTPTATPLPMPTLHMPPVHPTPPSHSSHPSHPTHPPPQPLMSIPTVPPTPQPPTNLPKDFQEALDIIFPSEVKTELSQQELFSAMASGFPMPLPGMGGMGMGGMPGFPPLGLMQPQMMMGFDMNPALFPPPQLYDTHVPLVPKTQRKNHNRKMNANANNSNKQKPKDEAKPKAQTEVANPTRNKAELDELAMLGIDASDVGAGI